MGILKKKEKGVVFRKTRTIVLILRLFVFHDARADELKFLKSGKTHSILIKSILDNSFFFILLCLKHSRLSLAFSLCCLSEISFISDICDFSFIAIYLVSYQSESESGREKCGLG